MENIVLYGAGLVADELLKKQLDVHIEAVTDSNENIWGKEWKGHRITPPGEVPYDEADKVIIATFDYYDEIKEQLIRKYHVEEKKIEGAGRFYARHSEEVKPEKAVGAAMIIRDGARYIDEWIAYHLLIGVSHFYIYDNESTDNLKETLEKWINKGVVTYIYFPGECIQMAAYNHAIAHFRNEVKYLAVIDSDEYIGIADKKKTLGEVLEEIETNYEIAIDDHPGGGFGGVAVNWRVYGTSNHKKRQEGLVIENYTWRAEDFSKENILVKTICNPRRVERFSSPHIPIYKEGYCGISENGSWIAGTEFHDGMCRKLRINHYHSKSEEELREKFKRGWPDQKHLGIEELECELEKRLWRVRRNQNAVEDRMLADYADEVRRMLEEVR